MQTAVQTWRGSCCCRCLKRLNRERLFSTWSLLLFAELSRRTKSTESKARLLWEQVIGFSDEHDPRSRALIRESSEFSMETFRNNSETLGGAARFRAPFCGTDLRKLVRAVDLETTGIRLQALGSTTSKSFGVAPFSEVFAPLGTATLWEGSAHMRFELLRRKDVDLRLKEKLYRRKSHRR